MANIVTTNQLMPYLKKGITAVLGLGNQVPLEYPYLYTEFESTKAFETYIEDGCIVGGGRMNELDEAPAAEMTIVGTVDLVNFKYGMKFSISLEAIEDNQYPEYTPRALLGLKKSMQILKEKDAISQYDNAFDPISPEFYGRDKKPICARDHPNLIGTYSNRVDDAQISVSVIQDMVTLCKTFTNNGGQNITANPKGFLIGTENSWAAEIIFKSEKSPTTADNAINPLYSKSYTRNIVESRYTDNPFSFFLFTDYANGRIYQNRKELTIVPKPNDNNDSVNVQARARWRFSLTTPKALVGCRSSK